MKIAIAQDKRSIITIKRYKLLALISTAILIFSLYFYYNNYYLGDYQISKIYFDSQEGECEDCLHIEFYEGCNRYQVYYFANQYELDERLSVGMPVNIKFMNGIIQGVFPATKYRSKC